MTPWVSLAIILSFLLFAMHTAIKSLPPTTTAPPTTQEVTGTSTVLEKAHKQFLDADPLDNMATTNFLMDVAEMEDPDRTVAEQRKIEKDEAFKQFGEEGLSQVRRLEEDLATLYQVPPHRMGPPPKPRPTQTEQEICRICGIHQQQSSTAYRHLRA